MKRLTVLFIVTAMFFSLLLPTSAQEADYETVYAPILASAADLLSCENPDNHILGPGETGIREIRGGLASGEALENVGYVIRDLSGDGIPELILAQVDNQEAATSSGRRILAIFTCFGKTPSLILEGWGRNCYYLLPDGSILNQGSSGAAYSSLGMFRLNEGQLECLDFFFTEDENGEIVVYHNLEGIWDTACEGNERVDVDFWRLSEIMEADIQAIPLTPLSLYQEKEPASLLLPQWYSDGYLDAFRQITLSNQEYSTKIALCAYNGAVTELELLSLELENVEEDGTAHFKQTILETVAAVEPENPLVVQLEFGCSIPTFGIRYTDNAGRTQAYSLIQSGMDGSLVMNELE